MDNLWNNLNEDDVYKVDKKLYQEHILEQYKLYVEMADRISARRNLANVFFLTLNSGFISFLTLQGDFILSVENRIISSAALFSIVIVCYAWWRLIKSYRQLNTAKYQVIGALEKRLPSSPYWSAEWHALGEGKDSKKYIPLTRLENIVPIVFLLLYLIILLFVILRNFN